MDDAVNEDLFADLRRFGPPLFVPSGSWWVAGIDHTGGQPDGALVFGSEGRVELRTVSLARGLTPISIRVSNVQAGTVNGSNPREWHRVNVDEVECGVPIGGVSHLVRALCSHNSFSFETVIDDRIVSAAGDRQLLDNLRIERLEDLCLTAATKHA